MLYVELRNNRTVYEELPSSIEALTIANVVLLVIVVQNISKKWSKIANIRMTRHIVDDFVAKIS